MQILSRAPADPVDRCAAFARFQSLLWVRTAQQKRGSPFGAASFLLGPSWLPRIDHRDAFLRKPIAARASSMVA